MKTIQQMIKELDPQDIEKVYLYTFPINIHELENDDVTISEIKQKISTVFQDFLSNIKTHGTVKTTKEAVLFATKNNIDENRSTDTELVYIDELLNSNDVDEVKTYAYEFTPWEEMLNFYVAGTELTQLHLMSVVVDFIHTMSFFGFDEAKHIKEKNELEQSLEEAINDIHNPEKLKSYKSFEDFEKEMGWKRKRPKKYPKEEDYRDKYIKASREYSLYCRNQELLKIKEMLINESKID
ncbi:DUF6557 family protein [Pseudobutyrivibrio sp. LB2011]|uniref:DUF6557 family protein n=1 Tax=Pseudobutyrivibrio sp. LB2011 TaxID=1408312 RepID=UPI0005D19BAE|nr:DUF6557 family protein [Pseudobutyrivibrio sp. LB2011]